MSEWAQVNGGIALYMMEASAHITKLNQMFEKLQRDIAFGQSHSFYAGEVRRQGNRLSEVLKSIEFQLEQEEKASKDKIKVVK